MTLDEIKAAIDEGRTVYHQTPNYQVIRDNLGQYLIQCRSNDYCIGLTWQDGKTLNGKPYEFFTKNEIYTDHTNFSYISRDGVALDEHGHEIRDENGAIVIVPPEERGFYDIAYRPNETPEDWE
jgi:hypothetical protein